jgi:hypothetical protein
LGRVEVTGKVREHGLPLRVQGWASRIGGFRDGHGCRLPGRGAGAGAGSRRAAKGEESAANGVGDPATNILLAVELYLTFRWVDVDIDGGRVDFEEQTADGIAALHQGGVVTFEQGKIDAAVLHRPFVYKDVLILARGAGHAGRTHPTPNPERFSRLKRLPEVRFVSRWGRLSMKVYREKFLFGTVESAKAFLNCGEERLRSGAGADGWELPDQAAVFLKDEGDFRIGQGGESEVMLDVGGLSLLATEEFAASGQVEEKLTDLDLGAGSGTSGFNLEDFAARDNDLGTFRGVTVAVPRGKGEAADAGDAGQSFAAESHGADGREVLRPTDFTRSMALKAKESVVPTHANAVIGNADKAASAGLDLYRDLRCTGVHGVLDQLFNDAGGPFDHLASGDLVGDLLWQQPDAIHRLG